MILTITWFLSSFLLTNFLICLNILKKKWVFTVQLYCSSGLLVSFFIVVISCRYLYPSSECLISKIAVKTLYLSNSPVTAKKKGGDKKSPPLISLVYLPPFCLYLQGIDNTLRRCPQSNGIDLSSSIVQVHIIRISTIIRVVIYHYPASPIANPR